MTQPAGHNRTKKTLASALNSRDKTNAERQAAIGPRSHGFALQKRGGVGMGGTNSDQPGITPGPVGSASDLYGPYTIAASGSLTLVLGLAASISAVEVFYSFLRNSTSGSGNARLFHNIGTAAVGGGIYGEDAEDVDGSFCTMVVQVNVAALELKVTNGDATNAVVISMRIRLIPNLT